MREVTFTDTVRPVSSLMANADNVRHHPDEQIAALARAIREFGFTSPLLITDDGTLVAGHARLEAAKEVGLASVPVRIVDGWSPDQVRAYMLADNRLAELASWDDAGLRRELEALDEADFDFATLGWTDEEIEALTNIGAPPIEIEDGFSDTERTASGKAMVRIGPYRFKVEIDTLENWITGIRAKVGDTEEAICGEMRKRLGIPK